MNLFSDQFPQERLHASYIKIKNDPYYAPVLPILSDWAAGLMDRRGEGNKFRKEFQTTFNSSFWELYLNKLFREMKYSIDYTKSSPDFYVQDSQGRSFNVEAVITDNPSNHAHIFTSDKDYKRYSAIRLAGKIRDKVALFRGDGGKKVPYKNLDHVADRPFIIAISPFDSSISLFQNNELINLVLFGLGAPSLKDASLGHQETVDKIYKASGAEIDVGIFTNDSCKEVSAVIFSTTGSLGKAIIESRAPRLIRSTRYREVLKACRRSRDKEWQTSKSWCASKFSLDFYYKYRMDFNEVISGGDVRICHSDLYNETHFDGIHVYYNPYANNPLDRDLMWPDEFTHNFYDPINKVSRHEHPDGALVSRQVYEVDVSVLDFLMRSYGFWEA